MNQIENQQLSQHYSQRNNIHVDTKKMRKCIFAEITMIILESIGIAFFLFHDIDYMLRISLLFSGLPILCSFDIPICYGSRNNTQIRGLSYTMESQQYLANVMAEFYKSPQRNLQRIQMVQSHET